MLINSTRWRIFLAMFCLFTLPGCPVSPPEEGDTIVTCACGCQGNCLVKDELLGGCSVRGADGVGEAMVCTKSTADFTKACRSGCGKAFRDATCSTHEPVTSRPQECTTDPDGRIKTPKIEFLMNVDDEANVTYMGLVDTARSRLTVRHDGASASPPISGRVHAEGGNCPGQACPMEIRLLELFANSFDLSGERVSLFRALNHGIWTGFKLADETYYFNDGSQVAVAGEISGEHASQVGWPNTTVTGAWHDDLTTLPGGTTIQDRYMTIEGTWTADEVTVEMFLVVRFGPGRRPTVSIRSQTCPPTQGCNSQLVAVVTSPTNRPIVKYAWTDAEGRLLGTGTTLNDVNQIILSPTLEFPITLTVVDDKGTSNSATIGGPERVEGAAIANDGVGFSAATGDFNGDGYADALVGAPFDKTANNNNLHGSVHVLYGGLNGVTTTFNRRWDQDGPGVTGAPESLDMFGAALAVGDFDGDGFDDAAIGAPGEMHGSAGPNEGMVNILYGSPNGLTGESIGSRNPRGGLVEVHQAMAAGFRIGNTAEQDDMFGSSLAAGDFNGDGADDLAIGVPAEDTRRGLIHIVYGRRFVGIATESSNAVLAPRILSQSTFGDDLVDRDAFGEALAVADLDRDGFSDLMIGAPGEDSNAGRISVIYANASGFNSSPTRAFERTGGSGEALGTSITAGAFRVGEPLGIAVGAPSTTVGGDLGAGKVLVLRPDTSFGNRFSSASQPLIETLHQDVANASGDICGVTEPGDAFGVRLSSGDLNGDGAVDLLVGVPNEDIGSFGDGGYFHVFYAKSSGRVFDIVNDPCPNADTLGFGAGSNHRLGLGIAAGDFDRNGKDDVLWTAPGGSGNLGMFGINYSRDLMGDLLITPITYRQQGSP